MTRGGARHLCAMLGLRQAAGLIHDSRIATLERNSLLEFFPGLAAFDERVREGAGFVEGLHALAKVEHPGGKFDAERAKIFRAAATEHFDAFGNLQGVAGDAAERLIHVRYESNDLLAEAAAGIDHQLGEAYGVFLTLDEGARTELYVENQRVNAFGQLLAHDRGADEGMILDGGRNIAQGVNFLVRGSDLRRLADQAHAAFAENATEVGQREIDVEAGDGLELIERAARVAKPAAADHGNNETAGGDNGSQNERGFVADAARRMLVHLPGGHIG